MTMHFLTQVDGLASRKHICPQVPACMLTFAMSEVAATSAVSVQAPPGPPLVDELLLVVEPPPPPPPLLELAAPPPFPPDEELEPVELLPVLLEPLLVDDPVLDEALPPVPVAPAPPVPPELLPQAAKAAVVTRMKAPQIVSRVIEYLWVNVRAQRIKESPP